MKTTRTKFATSFSPAAAAQQREYQYPEGSVGNMMEKSAVVFQQIMDSRVLYQPKEDAKASVKSIILGSDLDKELQELFNTIFSDIDYDKVHEDGASIGHRYIDSLGEDGMEFYYLVSGLFLKDPESIAGFKTGDAHFKRQKHDKAKLRGTLAVDKFLEETNLLTSEILKSFVVDSNLFTEDLVAGGGFDAKKSALGIEQSQANAVLSAPFNIRKTKSPSQVTALGSAAAADDSLELGNDKIPSTLERIIEFMDNFSAPNHKLTNKLMGRELGEDIFKFINLRVEEGASLDDAVDLTALKLNINDGSLSDPKLLDKPRALFDQLKENSESWDSFTSDQRKLLKVIREKIDAINEGLEQERLQRAKVTLLRPEPQVLAPVRQKQPQPQPQAVPPSRPQPKPEIKKAAPAKKPKTPEKIIVAKPPEAELEIPQASSKLISADADVASEVSQAPVVELAAAQQSITQASSPQEKPKPAAVPVVKSPELNSPQQDIKSKVPELYEAATICKRHFEKIEKFRNEFAKGTQHHDLTVVTKKLEEAKKINAALFGDNPLLLIKMREKIVALASLPKAHPDKKDASKAVASANGTLKLIEGYLSKKDLADAIKNAEEKFQSLNKHKSDQEAVLKKAEDEKIKLELERKAAEEKYERDREAAEQAELKKGEKKASAERYLREAFVKSAEDYRKLNQSVIRLADALFKFRRDCNAINGTNSPILGPDGSESHLGLMDIINDSRTAGDLFEFASEVDAALKTVLTKKISPKEIYDFVASEINVDPALIDSFQKLTSALEDTIGTYRSTGKIFSADEDLFDRMELQISRSREKFPPAMHLEDKAREIREARNNLVEIAKRFYGWMNSSCPNIIEKLQETPDHPISLFCNNVERLQYTLQNHPMQLDNIESLRSGVFQRAFQLQKYMATEEGREFFSQMNIEQAPQFLEFSKFNSLTLPAEKTTPATVGIDRSPMCISSYEQSLKYFSEIPGNGPTNITNYSETLDTIRFNFSRDNAKLISQYSSEDMVAAVARNVDFKAEIFAPNQANPLSLYDVMKTVDGLMAIKRDAFPLRTGNAKLGDCANLLQNLRNEAGADKTFFNFEKCLLFISNNKGSFKPEEYNEIIVPLHLAITQFSCANRNALSLLGLDAEAQEENASAAVRKMAPEDERRATSNNIDQIVLAADLALVAFTQLTMILIKKSDPLEVSAAVQKLTAGRSPLMDSIAAPFSYPTTSFPTTPSPPHVPTMDPAIYSPAAAASSSAAPSQEEMPDPDQLEQPGAAISPAKPAALNLKGQNVSENLR